MAATTHTNVKKLLLPTTMSKAGWAIVEAREDVQGVEFAPTISNAEFHALLEDAAGIALGVRRFSDPELDAAPQLQVVSRIGVGYDEVDVPALNKRKVPLMIGGTSNSVSVAEACVFTNVVPGSTEVVRPWVEALRNVGFAVFAKPKVTDDSDVDDDMLAHIEFREYANFALTSEVIEFVDLEEIDGVFREPLPRMTLETLPDTGAWLPPFRSLRSLLEPRR